MRSRAPGQYLFNDHEAVCEGYTINEGRISQRLRRSGRWSASASHPIAADGLLTSIVDVSKGPHGSIYQDVERDVPSTSRCHRPRRCCAT
ncbi:MAG: hypothetical protein U1F11_12980 [Steroidobacteraceae bacterium]